jgi:hypothetical protein
MKKNPKKPTSILLSEDQEDFLVTHPLGRTEVIKNALLLFSEIDWEIIKVEAHNLGLRPGMLVKVAIHYFTLLPKTDRRHKIADFLDYLNELEEKEGSKKE